jgi:hypothetical protein
MEPGPIASGPGAFDILRISMEKKEQYSMKKHRGVFLALGLAALMGLMASEAGAATMTLSVYAGSGTGGTLLFHTGVGGGTQSAQFDGGAITTAIQGAGYGAYTFSGISAASNNTGTLTNAFINMNGGLAVIPGVTGGVGGNGGANSPITVVVREDGFLNPASGTGNTLNTQGSANYVNTANDSFSTPIGGLLTPDTTVTGTTLMTSTTSPLASKPLGVYSSPFSLLDIMVLSLSPGTGTSSTNPGTNTFTNKVFVTAAVPEPASIVMMLTGMPLPLVVLGILRRRRAAA